MVKKYHILATRQKFEDKQFRRNYSEKIQKENPIIISPSTYYILAYLFADFEFNLNKLRAYCIRLNNWRNSYPEKTLEEIVSMVLQNKTLRKKGRNWGKLEKSKNQQL